MERLWPDEQTQPVWELVIGEDLYSLRWQDTWVQRYRTRDERYDGELHRYDHVVHKYSEQEESSNYVIIAFDQLGEEGMKFLESRGYPMHTDPIPSRYILNYMASKESIDIPDAPEFGLGEAAA